MGVFNKTIIPLALVGYEMITTNSALRASLASYISYPTRPRGIIVKYTRFQKGFHIERYIDRYIYFCFLTRAPVCIYTCYCLTGEKLGSTINFLFVRFLFQFVN